MKELENKNYSKAKLFVIIIVISVFVSIIMSSVVVKTLVPSSPTFSPTSTYNIQSTITLITTQPPVTETPTRLPASLPDALTPMKIEMPKIESNLLQNSGFENGLSGWTFSDNVAGINVFETVGVNGKAFCSRRYTNRKDFLEKIWAGFVQEVPIDPNQTYFFSGWVKLNKAITVGALAEWYNWSHNTGWAATHPIGILPNGETTSGWVFIHDEIFRPPPSTNRAVFGIWHGLIYDVLDGVDSTVCVDDLVFGKIVK